MLCGSTIYCGAHQLLFVFVLFATNTTAQNANKTFFCRLEGDLSVCSANLKPFFLVCSTFDVKANEEEWRNRAGIINDGIPSNSKHFEWSRKPILAVAIIFFSVVPWTSSQMLTHNIYQRNAIFEFELYRRWCGLVPSSFNDIPLLTRPTSLFSLRLDMVMAILALRRLPKSNETDA